MKRAYEAVSVASRGLMGEGARDMAMFQCIVQIKVNKQGKAKNVFKGKCIQVPAFFSFLPSSSSTSSSSSPFFSSSFPPPPPLLPLSGSHLAQASLKCTIQLKAVRSFFLTSQVLRFRCAPPFPGQRLCLVCARPALYRVSYSLCPGALSPEVPTTIK